jgi:hypothetical protein
MTRLELILETVNELLEGAKRARERGRIRRAEKEYATEILGNLNDPRSQSRGDLTKLIALIQQGTRGSPLRRARAQDFRTLRQDNDGRERAQSLLTKGSNPELEGTAEFMERRKKHSPGEAFGRMSRKEF